MNRYVFEQLRDLAADGNADAAMDRISAACDILKAVSHESRFLILCHLATGQKTVSELEALLSQRQSAVSQQLARLRHEGLVDSEREGKTIMYRLSDPRAGALIDFVFRTYCVGERVAPAPASAGPSPAPGIARVAVGGGDD